MLPIERQNPENLKSLIATLADLYNWDKIRVKELNPVSGPFVSVGSR